MNWISRITLVTAMLIIASNAFAKETFIKPSMAELRKTLSPLQFKVTQQDGTEPPFKNTYWDNKEPGIYVDIVSGEPLFSSLDKFRSGTGWPSFTKPLVAGNVTEHEDTTLFMRRVEVRSKLKASIPLSAEHQANCMTS